LRSQSQTRHDHRCLHSGNHGLSRCVCLGPGVMHPDRRPRIPSLDSRCQTASDALRGALERHPVPRREAGLYAPDLTESNPLLRISCALESARRRWAELPKNQGFYTSSGATALRLPPLFVARKIPPTERGALARKRDRYASRPALHTPRLPLPADDPPPLAAL
jgi:hypothetical protein